MLSSIGEDDFGTDDSSVLQHIVRLAAAMDSVDSPLANENAITGSTVLLPAIRLFQSLLITLGKLSAFTFSRKYCMNDLDRKTNKPRN